ncbi:hypothetical protein MRB53_023444 [Persea americana]|uniref:Uncharacterized protein n=1 Tax=Persea americana TaxID=3435 RepID=A0ACC2L9M2_PERAE|nr:hypothetical protein MRB53_023444 [Persea americana]
MCPKLLKCASNDDMITVKAVDDADTVTFIFESPRPGVVEEDVAEGCSFFPAENKRSCCTLPVWNGGGVDVAERRKALLRNMWTERIHGAKQNVELTLLSFLFLGLWPVRRMKRHFNSSNS